MGNLNGILRAVRLRRATMRNIRQNLFFAFIYDALCPFLDLRYRPSSPLPQ